MMQHPIGRVAVLFAAACVAACVASAVVGVVIYTLCGVLVAVQP